MHPKKGRPWASTANWIVVLDNTIKKYDKDTLFIFGHAFDPDKVTGNKDDLLKEKAIPGVTEWQGDGIELGLQATYEELFL